MINSDGCEKAVLLFFYKCYKFEELFRSIFSSYFRAALDIIYSGKPGKLYSETGGKFSSATLVNYKAEYAQGSFTVRDCELWADWYS